MGCFFVFGKTPLINLGPLVSFLPFSGGCVKWTDRWAERPSPYGGYEKWGDKWEERFGDGKGTKTGETWSESGAERYQRWWGENHFGDGYVQKFGHSTTGECLEHAAVRKAPKCQRMRGAEQEAHYFIKLIKKLATARVLHASKTYCTRSWLQVSTGIPPNTWTPTTTPFPTLDTISHWHTLPSSGRCPSCPGTTPFDCSLVAAVGAGAGRALAGIFLHPCTFFDYLTPQSKLSFAFVARIAFIKLNCYRNIVLSDEWHVF